MNSTQRVVVVTGGGTGIGKAIAARFLADGERVVITGRREQVLRETADELRDSAHGEILWHVCDVGDGEQVDALVSWIATDVAETVDVLVNNAGGVLHIGDDASTLEMERYANETLSGNLVGTFLMVHALGPRLRRPGGRIVNFKLDRRLPGWW